MGQAFALKVVITDCEHGFIDPEREILNAIGADVVLHRCRTEQDVAGAAADADGLMVGYAPVTARVLDAAPRCRVVSRYGIGMDMVDIPAATERGVVVTNVPDYCLDDVADHAMALVLCLARKLTQLDRAVRDGTAVKDGQWNTLGLVRPVRRLGQQTLGIVGLGQIGRRVAQRARAFGMRVIAAPDPAVSPEQADGLGVTMLPLEGMLAEADFVTLHCPLTPDTRGLINTRTIAMMKPTAVIVNTSRGPLVAEAALVEALRSGRLAGAGLDVYEREPLAPHSPLSALPNVVLTSHAAWYSEEAIRDSKVKAAQAVADVLQGRVPRYILNPAALAAGRK